jgi:septal ring factor EnvC (AmiA/AmiB activator)
MPIFANKEYRNSYKYACSALTYHPFGKAEIVIDGLGRVVSSYGSMIPLNSGDDEVKQEGVCIELCKYLLYSPIQGVVSYADKFRSYGNLLIIEHSINDENSVDGGSPKKGSTYWFLIVGLQELFVRKSDALLSGELIGKVNRRGGVSKYFGLESVSNRFLYVELRRRDKTVDPVKWFSSLYPRKLRSGCADGVD